MGSRLMVWVGPPQFPNVPSPGSTPRISVEAKPLPPELLLTRLYPELVTGPQTSQPLMDAEPPVDAELRPVSVLSIPRVPPVAEKIPPPRPWPGKKPRPLPPPVAVFRAMVLATMRSDPPLFELALL